MKAEACLPGATVLLVATHCLMLVNAAPLVTLQNSTLSVPGASLAAAGLPGATNLVGSNVLLSAVAPATVEGGRASLVNSLRWVRRYNGGPASTPYGMAVRADGSVVVTGSSSGPGTDSDFATVCYAADGAPLWTNRYDGPAHGADTARLLAANAGGDVWVVGSSMRYATNSRLADVVVIKYESDGMPAWTNRYTSFETNDVYPTELAVDNSGGAYVKQWVIYWGTSGLGTPVESVIAKYDALGNVVWSKHYPESAPGSGQGLQSVGPMALDDAGNLFVAGTAGRVLYNPGNLIVKFAGDGTALWTNQHPSQLMHDIDLLSVDRQGNAIVTGSRWSNAMTDYVVMQCSKDGVLLWTNVLSGPTYNGGNVPQTVPEVAGNVFVIGGSPGASPGLYQILKVSSNGVPLWTNQTINFGSTNGMIQGSAVDSAGNLYLLGNAPAPGSDYPDYVILKYSGDGQPLWTNRFNGAANRDDFAVALGVDGAGNVYVTGTSESQAGQRDFATAKYADLLFYSPPEDFTGSDTITCTLTDNFGNHATGRVEVLVMPGSFQFSLSPASTKLTPAGMELQVEGVPGTNAVVLEASTDLVSWQRILTNAPDHGSVQFLDPAAVSLPQRFYRAIQEQ